MAATLATTDAGGRPSVGGQPDNCPFCLEPLGSNNLVLECGHCFHSRCCVQFLMKRKQCPCCRSPVRAEGILDAAEVPEAAMGKQYCPPSPRTAAADDTAVQIRALAAPPSPRQSTQQQAPSRRMTRSATAAAAAAAAQQQQQPNARTFDGHSRHAVPVPMSRQHSPIVAAQLTAVMPPPGHPPPRADDVCAPTAFARAVLVVGAVVAAALVVLIFVV